MKQSNFISSLFGSSVCCEVTKNYIPSNNVDGVSVLVNHERSEYLKGQNFEDYSISNLMKANVDVSKSGNINFGDPTPEEAVAAAKSLEKFYDENEPIV